MAVDKLVDSSQLDADLSSVANAIRTKGGTSASLAFPADFISAIGSIPTGGGSSVLSGTFTPASDTDVVTIQALAGMTQDHLWIKPSGKMTNGLVTNKRTVVYSWIDFSSGNKNAAFAATNTSGTNYSYNTDYGDSYFNSQGDLDSTRYSFVRSTGVLTCKIPTTNFGGKWAAGVTYEWYAW